MANSGSTKHINDQPAETGQNTDRAKTDGAEADGIEIDDTTTDYQAPELNETETEAHNIVSLRVWEIDVWGDFCKSSRAEFRYYYVNFVHKRKRLAMPTYILYPISNISLSYIFNCPPITQQRSPPS